MNPLFQITHINLKETNVLLGRIATALELILYQAFDIKPEALKEKANTGTEGTSVTYSDPDEQAVAEELEKMGYPLPDEPEDPENPLRPL
jgi:hypothetical protein